MKEEEKRMLFHYQSIEGIGYKTIMKLLKHIGVKNDVGCVPGLEEWEDIGKIGEDELTMLVGKSKALKLIVGNREKSASQKAYDNTIKAKIAYVTCFESVFPDKLRNIYSINLLKWEIIKKYYKEGYKSFNLGNIPPLKNKDNKYHGIYLSKIGFNPKIYETCGTFDLVINKYVYTILKKMPQKNNQN